MRVLAVIGIAILFVLGCGLTDEQPDSAPVGNIPTETMRTASGASLPQLDRQTVIRARHTFDVELLSFDASQKYGSEFPYSDRVRLRITNNSEVTLPCLTLLTKRYAQGKMVGSSRAPPIPAPDIAPGESVEFDYYPKGHLDVVKVDRMSVEVEAVVSPENEQFVCELQNVRSSAANPASDATPDAAGRIVLGTPADSILAWRGRALSTRQTGNDEQGLLVEWEYRDTTYLLGRRVRDGIEAYRVVRITPNR